MAEVQTRHVPAQIVASLEGRVLAADLPAFIDRQLAAIHGALASSGCETGVPFVIFHGQVTETADGPVEVCVPFDGDSSPAGVDVRTEPAHDEAFVRLQKRELAYPEILGAYREVETWLSTHGHRMAGSPREVYLADWARPPTMISSATWRSRSRRRRASLRVRGAGRCARCRARPRCRVASSLS